MWWPKVCLLCLESRWESFSLRFLQDKWSVSVISTNLPFMEWHFRFTTLPFKLLFEQEVLRYSFFIQRKIKKPTTALVYTSACNHEPPCTALNFQLYQWGYLHSHIVVRKKVLRIPLWIGHDSLKTKLQNSGEKSWIMGTWLSWFKPFVSNSYVAKRYRG